MIGTGTGIGVVDWIASAVGAVAIGIETGVETVAVAGIVASGSSDRNAQNQHGRSPMSRRWGLQSVRWGRSVRS